MLDSGIYGIGFNGNWPGINDIWDGRCLLGVERVNFRTEDPFCLLEIISEGICKLLPFYCYILRELFKRRKFEFNLEDKPYFEFYILEFTGI